MSLLSPVSASPSQIRARLLRDLVLLVLLTVGLLGAVSWKLIDGLKREFASSRIENATEMVREEVRNLFGPVEQQLLIARDGLRAAGTGPLAGQSLDERFIPAMRHMEQIAGTAYAESSGAEYFLRREEGDWSTRLRPPGDKGAATWIRSNDQGEKLETREGRLDYDPRERPWYVAAIQDGGAEVSWSAPYIFHSLRVAGITASIAWDTAGATRVLALDVKLSSIIESIEQLSLDKQGSGFLFSGDGGIYVPGAKDGTLGITGGSHFFSAEERLGGPLFFDAVAAWKDQGRPTDDLVSFESGGKDWWGGFLPLSGLTNHAWVGVVLPVSETYGILQGRWHILVLTALLIIALGVGLVLILMRKYSHQLRDLPKLTIDRQDAQRDLYELIGKGEDTHLEFKSTMRTNLHTGKPGKEIELAWLKGLAAFMNTEGGILLMGVADDGTLLGLDADKFENEDRIRLHFKNLLNQHLGAEYARHVRFDLYELDDRRIGAVECERADGPVFLRHKNGESFLIRNGPSNTALSLSRALKYIRGRF